MPKEEKKVKPITIALAVLIAGVLYLTVIGFLVCFFPITGKMGEVGIIRKTAEFFPYPAAIAGTELIHLGQLAKEVDSVKMFYENQDFSQLGMRVDFGTPEGKKRLVIKEREILSKLIDDAIIEAEAKKRKIKVTSEIVDQEVDRKLKEYGTGDYLKENLQKLYGWDLEDFKKNIVKPDLYREKLVADIKKNDSTRAAGKNKIEEARKDLEDGADFSKTAEKYSEGESAKNGGDVGWFSADQMLPEMEAVVFDLKKGERSEIIESSIGYHIVKVEDRKKEGDEDMVRVRQVFVRAESFSDWLSDATKKYRIFIPLREFRWNDKTFQVEFQDKDMVKYEQDLLENPINDPSIIF